MAPLKHYHARHRSQLARSQSTRTHREGCTWTTGANGIAHATGGAHRPSPDMVLSLVPKADETNPRTPGWSLPDLDLAIRRLKIPGLDLVIVSGWDALVDWRNRGYYIAAAGSGDVFKLGCMAIFQGDHRFGIHPDESDGDWRINNPLCPTATHRDPARIREYMQHYADERTGGIISFGVFKPAVPRA